MMKNTNNDNKNNETYQKKNCSYKRENLEVFIEFVDLNRVYHPGDIVRLKIDINAKNNPTAKKIIAGLAFFEPAGLSFLGKVADVFFKNTIGLSKEQMLGASRFDIERGFHQVINKVIELRGQNGEGVCQSYNLDLKVPENIIQTYYGGPEFTSIRWFVRVTDDTVDEQGLYELEEIIVANPPPEQDCEIKEKIRKGKKVEFSLKLPKKNWVEGEEVQGRIIVCALDPTIGNVDINVALILMEWWSGANNNRHEITSASLAKNVLIPVGDWIEYPFTFSIPVMKRPSFKANQVHSQWCITASVGKGLFPTADSIEIDVFIAPTKTSETKTVTTYGIEKNYEEPNVFEQHKEELLRIRALHNDIKKAKAKGSAWGKPILFGSCLGITACFIAAIPLVLIFQNINGDSEPSPVPGLIGMIILMIVWPLTSFFIQRKGKQKSADLILKCEKTISSEINEIAKKDPNWLNTIGGTEALLDSSIVDRLLLKTGAKQL